MIDTLHKALESFKRSSGSCGIFSDLDGTLSGIAPTPQQATISEEVRQIIRALVEKYAVVSVVSGRNSDDAKKIVGVDDIVYVGNHGLEWIQNGTQHYVDNAAEYIALAPQLSTELSRVLNVPGIVLEIKKLGFSVHYRLAEDKPATEALVKAAIAPVLQKYPVRAFEGRYVIELKPDVPINKGDAVVALIRHYGLRNAIYIGDDITDVDAFTALRELQAKGTLHSVSVGVMSHESAPEIELEADYVVPDVAAVQALLGWLAS
ncbi:MAG TPA: trehalose-phosphatase [Candidatus Aquicultor sp.]|jgi:trehalose 6-phosphate phosphatase